MSTGPVGRLALPWAPLARVATFFVYGSGWANLVAEELGVTGAGEVTGGPMQNMALVHTGDLAFGLTTMGPAQESLNGTNPIAPGLQMDNVLRHVPDVPDAVPPRGTRLRGHHLACRRFRDGSVIGFGPAGSSADTYFPAMLEELGVSFERRNGGWDDLGSQMQDGLLDAIGFGRRRADSDREPARGGRPDISIVGFTADELATITENFPVSEFAVFGRHLSDARGGPDVGGDVELRDRQLRPAPRPSSTRPRALRWKTTIGW